MEGPVDAFCCAGCEVAYDLIRGAGLERYYDVREDFAPRPGGAVEGWESVPVERDAEGVAECRMQVDGLPRNLTTWL